jgi:Outer membrane protein beta-barrel domain
MKARNFSLVAILVLSVTALQAQVSFGVAAGPNFQNMTGKDSGGNKISNGLLVGFHAGVKATMPVATDFYFQTGLLFSQKGSKNNLVLIVSKSSGGDYNTTTRISYIELPVHLLYRPAFGKGHILVGFGPYIAYGIAGKQSTSIENFSYEPKIKFRSEIPLEDHWDMDHAYYRGFDAGADIFAGYEMDMGLFLQLNTQLGLLNMITEVTEWDFEPEFRNTGFGVSVGYNF